MGAGELELGALRMQFDRSVKVEFRGAAISSGGGSLLNRELDDALGLTEMAAGLIADSRTGSNGRHRIAGLLRQSVFSRLAGYEDVSDVKPPSAALTFVVDKPNGECRIEKTTRLSGGRPVSNCAIALMGTWRAG